MKRLALILGIGALVAPANLLAVTAQTGHWSRACQPSGSISNLTGGDFACFTPDTGMSVEGASPVLDVTQCDNIDVFMWDDYTGGGNTCTVTWMMDSCAPGASALATDALKNIACSPLPGFVALTGVGSGTDVESNLAGQYVRIRAEGAGVNITSCRVVVKCALASPR